MLASSLFCILAAALLSVLLCVLGVLLSLALQDGDAATGLLRAWVLNFNGILVGSTGYGLLFFIRRHGGSVLAQLSSAIELPEALVPRLAQLQARAISWSWPTLAAVPLTILGGWILWQSGFPLDGFARYYLATCTISLYFVASCILAFYLLTLAIFNRLEDVIAAPPIRTAQVTAETMRHRFETLDNFFVITATLGIAAVYIGFRGTLTANFVHEDGVYRDLLVLPIVIYLPTALVYSFYPRYVLRRLSERQALGTIAELEALAKKEPSASPRASLEIQSLILDVKEKMLRDYRATPVLGLKDAPSLTMSLLIVVQLLMKKDAVVTGFIERMFS